MDVIESAEYVVRDALEPDVVLDRYRINIIRDEDPMSPRDADNVTVMHTFDSGFYSPDDVTQKGEHDSIFPSEYTETPGFGWGGSSYPFDLRRAKKYAALGPDILMVRGLDRLSDGELYLSDRGDHASAGYIAITRKSWEMCMGNTPLEGETWADGRQVPSAEECIRQDLEAYNRYARGEYVGVTLEQLVRYTLGEGQGPWDGHETPPAGHLHKWVTVDSLWGIDDIEYARQEALSWMPDNVEEV